MQGIAHLVAGRLDSGTAMQSRSWLAHVRAQARRGGIRVPAGAEGETDVGLHLTERCRIAWRRSRSRSPARMSTSAESTRGPLQNSWSCHNGNATRILQAAALALGSVPAQDGHRYARQARGVPDGVPDLCASPTSHTVLCDVASDARLQCIEARGQIRFTTVANTRLKIVNLTVIDQGHSKLA
jgi:hypothetical protein